MDCGGKRSATAGRMPAATIHPENSAKDFWRYGVFLDREHTTTHAMKTYFYSIALLCLLTVAASGQSAAPDSSNSRNVLAATNDAPKLTKFDLDFPGGTPQALVTAIERATGRPLNVVIPDEYANEVSIPALRMAQVTVPALFLALEQASIKLETYRTGVLGGGFGSYQNMKTSISFQTSGTATDDSVWSFRGREKVPDLVNSKPTPGKVSRFYSLTPYLKQGLKAEDVTTAIQTAWKMLGEKETPTISYHQETELLIAVGEPGKLETIDAVLKALDQSVVIDPTTGLPVPQTRTIPFIDPATGLPVSPARANASQPQPSGAPKNKP